MSLLSTDITAAAEQARKITVTAPQVSTIAHAGLGDDQWLADSLALTTDTLTNVPGMVRDFLGHQAAAHLAVEARIARYGCVLLGDDMGLGKTQTMLASIAMRATVENPAIVIAPPVTRHGWAADLAAAFPHLTMHHLRGRKRSDVPQAHILFINDDPLTMKAWLSDVTKVNGDTVFSASPIARQASVIVRDEIHRDKGNGTKPGTRTKVMLALGEWARSAGVAMVGATGTLLTNRPVEAWFPLQILGGKDMVMTVTPGGNSMHAFLYRYCNPQKVWTGSRYVNDFRGVSVEQAQELHDYLRRSLYVRREKADLGDALPHAGWVVLPLAMQDRDALRRYNRIVNDLFSLIEEEGGMAAAMRASNGGALVQIMKMWEESGNVKAQAAAEYIIDLVKDGENVVAFHWHESVRATIAAALDKAGITYGQINGKVTGEARNAVIDDFQNGRTQVVIGQIKAAGMGVTLTAASHAVFVQTPWSAGDLKQAADRIYRVDDKTRAKAENGEAITWHVLHATDQHGNPLFDSRQWAVLEEKAMICDAVNAGQPVTMDEDSVIKMAVEAWYSEAKAQRDDDKFHFGW